MADLGCDVFRHATSEAVFTYTAEVDKNSACEDSWTRRMDYR